MEENKYEILFLHFFFHIYKFLSNEFQRTSLDPHQRIIYTVYFVCARDQKLSSRVSVLMKFTLWSSEDNWKRFNANKMPEKVHLDRCLLIRKCVFSFHFFFINSSCILHFSLLKKGIEDWDICDVFKLLWKYIVQKKYYTNNIKSIS